MEGSRTQPWRCARAHAYEMTWKGLPRLRENLFFVYVAPVEHARGCEMGTSREQAYYAGTEAGDKREMKESE
jgi:hypothetical protein